MRHIHRGNPTITPERAKAITKSQNVPLTRMKVLAQATEVSRKAKAAKTTKYWIIGGVVAAVVVVGAVIVVNKKGESV